MGARLLSGYARLQWLSIDVALGALGGGLLARGVCGSDAGGVWYAVLPLSVWVIYTLDHLLDARRLGAAASSPRHRFHHRHFNLIAMIATLVGLLAFVLAVWGMGLQGLAFGGAMAALTACHLLLVRWAGDRVAPWLLKELGVGLVYALGVWGWPLLLAWPRSGTAAVGLPLLQFWALAMANLLAFSWFERDLDRADGQTSFVRAIGSRAAQACIVGLLALMPVGTLLGWGLAWPLDLKAQGLLALMALGMGTLLLWPGWMARGERYRVVGDGVFLLPFLYVWLPA